MPAGFLITFREGLEAFLVVGIILSYISRCNLNQYKKWVYLGVFLGLLSAFFIGLLFQVYYTSFESQLGQRYLKISIMGLAVIILTYMVMWMTKNSNQMRHSIEQNVGTIVSQGSCLSLVVMGYLAILREGFETVLFLGALYGNNLNNQVIFGGILGLITALGVTIVLFRGIRKVPLKMFFNITGFLIILVGAGLLINLVGILQDLHILPILKAGLFDLGWIMEDSSPIGIFFKALLGYTHKPSLIQVSSYLFYFFITVSFLAPSGGQYKKSTSFSK